MVIVKTVQFIVKNLRFVFLHVLSILQGFRYVRAFGQRHEDHTEKLVFLVP